MSKSIFTKDGTAQGVAKQRLIETLAKPNKRVINDPYADSFVIGAGFMKLMGHNLNLWLARKFAPVGRTLPENQIFKLKYFVIAES